MHVRPARSAGRTRSYPAVHDQRQRESGEGFHSAAGDRARLRRSSPSIRHSPDRRYADKSFPPARGGVARRGYQRGQRRAAGARPERRAPRAPPRGSATPHDQHLDQGDLGQGASSAFPVLEKAGRDLEVGGRRPARRSRSGGDCCRRTAEGWDRRQSMGSERRRDFLSPLYAHPEITPSKACAAAPEAHQNLGLDQRDLLVEPRTGRPRSRGRSVLCSRRLPAESTEVLTTW